MLGMNYRKEKRGMSIKAIVLSILMLTFSAPLFGQGLFESATSGSEESGGDENLSYELNGFLRATMFTGKVPGENEFEMKSSYAEADLQLKVNKVGFGDAFAELSFRNGNEFDEEIENIDLKEAYINWYVGRFDFRVGHQIVVWGRADGFNPTDNITPKNMLVRSPDEDDRRLANFLVRTWYNMHPIRLELIWIPNYAASVIPTDIIPMPSYIALNEAEYPDGNLDNSGLAIRVNFEKPSIDGSISYFNGYNPSPGLYLESLEYDSGNVIFNVEPKAYCMHVVGADFQTTIGSYGFRGEFAYRHPYEDYELHDYVPYPDLQYVLGFDKEFGPNTSLILQYMGRYVFDFEELVESTEPMKIGSFRLADKNRLIAFQTEEITHSISFRPARTFMYETLTAEVLGMYNFTTEEMMLRPKISYDITDDFTATIGGEIYSGPDESLYGSIDSYLSAAYFEIMVSF